MNIPPGFAQVNLKFSGTNLPTNAECAFGVELLDLTDTPTTVGTQVIAAYDASGLDTRQTDDVTLSGVLVKFGPNAFGPSAEVAAAVAGKFVTTTMPPNTTFLFHKNTALGGRAGRGRMYFPGVPEVGVNDAGVLPQAEIDPWNGALSAFRTALIAADIPMVLLHGLSGPILIPTPVTSLTIDSRVATQRRRLRR